MLNDISTFLGNPLNQILLSVPLSVVGNFTSDAVKGFWDTIRKKNQINDLEELLFSSFDLAISMHGRYYDDTAKKAGKTIRDVITSRKEVFLGFLREHGEDLPFLPSALNDAQIQKNFSKALIEVFSDCFPENQKDFIEIITRDVSRSYRDAFFRKISKDQQIWIAFNQSLKIDSIIDLLCTLQENTPTRSQFESIRKYILEREGTPENIDAQRKNYLAYLLRKFSLLELKGFSPRVSGVDISFKLTEIFIPFQLTKNGKKGGESSWFESRDYYNLFQENDNLRYEKARLLSSIEDSPRIVILGDPGSGKSTLLKFITVQICSFQDTGKLLPFYIPIFLRVSDYAKTLKSDRKTRLLDYLYNEYDRQFSGLFKWAFENRRALLLLDGLDEVLDATQRIKVVEELNDLVARMPENRYIVTSRIVGYNDAKMGMNFDQLVIQPFNRNQIEVFCNTWYTAVARSSEQDLRSALTDSKSLYNAIIQKPEVEKLASNPLLVTLIASIHFKGQSLPYNRVELYDIATETLLQYWVHSRVFEESQLKDEDLVVGLLSPIAFYIHKTNSEGVIEEDAFEDQCYKLLVGNDYGYTAKDAKNEIREIKKFLREQAGFFHEKGIDEVTKTRLFGFLHQTFQEYLAAIELVNLWKESTLALPDFTSNPRWVEVIRLAAGILKSEKGRSGKKSAAKFTNDILDIGDTAECILLVSYILSDNIDIDAVSQESFCNKYFEFWEKSTSKDADSSFSKSYSMLLKSKYKEIVWKKTEERLSDSQALCLKFPSALSQNRNLIVEFKLLYKKFLSTNNLSIAEAFWQDLKEIIDTIGNSVGWDRDAYYYQHQYSNANYVFYDPFPEINSLVKYEEFVEIVQSLSAENLLALLSTIRVILRDYLFIYRVEWLNGVDVNILMDEMKNTKSPSLFLVLMNLVESTLTKEDVINNIEIINKLFLSLPTANTLLSEYMKKFNQKYLP